MRGVMHIVRLADVPTMPWKNGGGVTRDVLAWPDAAHWQCRISVADVERSGPFSAYPGVDRWFAVLHGAGVVLHLPRGPQRLVPGSAPLYFDGADAPGCDLVDGATLDLNLMVQQAAGRGAMVAAGTAAWVDEAPLRAVFCVSPMELLVEGGPPLALPAMSLAWSDDAAGQTWRVTPGCAVVGQRARPRTPQQPLDDPLSLNAGTAALAPSPAERERAGGEGGKATASATDPLAVVAPPLPCRAHPGLQAGIAQPARRRRLETPASPPRPLPASGAREPTPRRATARLAGSGDMPAAHTPPIALPQTANGANAGEPHAWWLSFHPHAT